MVPPAELSLVGRSAIGAEVPGSSQVEQKFRHRKVLVNCKMSLEYSTLLRSSFRRWYQFYGD